MLRLDHVIVPVEDLDSAAARLEDELGILSVPGGVHPSFGTANRIAPVGGGSYVELMAVHDAEVAGSTPLGQWVTARRGDGLRPGTWVLAADDVGLEEVAVTLGINVRSGSRTLPDGSEVRWRLAGFNAMLTRPPLPAFIAWDGPGLHPADTTVAAPPRTEGVAWVELGGAAAVGLDGWLAAGGHLAGTEVRHREGVRDLVAVGLRTADGEDLVLR